MYVCISVIDTANHPHHHPSNFIRYESFVVISNFLILKRQVILRTIECIILSVIGI